VLEDVAAAEAEADRGLLGAVADAALVGLGHQRVERRVDALSSFAVHATDEGDIFVARHLLRALDRKLGDAEPVRHHQQQWTFAADLLVPNERAFAFDAARLIVNPFDYHI
jgi:hypothetical protein